MRKRSFFWKPFGSERVNESEKLLKSAEKYFYPSFSLFWAYLTSEAPFQVRYQILGLLVKTLTASYDFSPSNMEKLSPPIHMQLSETAKSFSPFFMAFSVLNSILNNLEKTLSLEIKYFWSCWLQNMSLLKRLKDFVGEKPLAVHVLTSPKK